MRGYRWLTVTAIAVVLVGSYALAHGPNERHQGDPNSPSDVMMEQRATIGMGPQGTPLPGG